MTRRKLFSFNGYHGFRDQLQDGEDLVVDHMDGSRKVQTVIHSLRDFRHVEKLKTESLLGFYAQKRERVLVDIWINDLDVHYGSTINRPVEDLVFMAIALGVPAISLL